jgi:hypothetical protein
MQCPTIESSNFWSGEEEVKSYHGSQRSARHKVSCTGRLTVGRKINRTAPHQQQLRGLNLAAVRPMTINVTTKVPLQPELLLIRA